MRLNEVTMRYSEPITGHRAGYLPTNECNLRSITAAENQYFQAGFVSAMIYVMDSGGGQLPEQITTEQLSWFRAEWELNVRVYGHVPIVVTFHIPIPEYEVLYNVSRFNHWSLHLNTISG